MGSRTCTFNLSLFFLLGSLGFLGSLYAQAPSNPENGFNAGAPEVEPVVVGRERWNEKTKDPETPTKSLSEGEDDKSDSQTSRINELDPLETQQVKPEPTELPISPPKNKPATQIVRNFEGTLVFKPRQFGFANEYPYQLENSQGKRLAFVDVNFLKGTDAQDFADEQVNVMGKLEPVEEGSDDLVIRARVLRLSN